jgi:hypothetical protein
MKTYVHLLHLSELLLEWEICKHVIEKFGTHILSSLIFSLENRAIYECCGENTNFIYTVSNVKRTRRNVKS